MCVVVSNINTLVPNAVCNRRSRKSHINQQGYRAVSEVMDTNPLYAGLLCAPVHFPVQVTLSNGKHSVLQLNIIEHFQIVLNLIRKELRHFDGAVAFLGFGRSDQILTVQPLVGLIDGHGTLFKIKVGWCKASSSPSQIPTSTAFQRHRRTVAYPSWRLRISGILPLSRKAFLDFSFCPYCQPFAGIFSEIIVPHCMVENGTELIVDSF